jgi:hypothetical protein
LQDRSRRPLHSPQRSTAAQEEAVVSIRRAHSACAVCPPPIEYGPDDQVRKVQQGGWLSFQGRTLCLSKALAGQPDALRPCLETDGLYKIYFCHQLLHTLKFEITIYPLICYPCLRTVVTYVSSLYTPQGEGIIVWREGIKVGREAPVNLSLTLVPAGGGDFLAGALRPDIYRVANRTGGMDDPATLAVWEI